MLLKEVYNQEFIDNILDCLKKFDPEFSSKKFLFEIKSSNYQNLELKERMNLLTQAINSGFINKNFQQKIEILKKVIVQIPQSRYLSLALIIFPNFVETFYEDESDFDFSLHALEFFTEFGSSEFAIRKFIKINSQKSLGVIEKWSKSKNYHIRRLASEGIRPKLPWGCKLEIFQKDPNPVIKILENLKNDDSQYVLKSVANNLNDISKDNPEIVLQILEKWQKEGINKFVIKHALRTLLKQGNVKALKIIGIASYNKNSNFFIESFDLQKTTIKVGADLGFSFVLNNKSQSQNIRLEHAIYFLKNNNSHNKKVFQIISKSFNAGSFKFERKFSFKEITTRKYYSGKHFISLIVNGFELEKKEFELI